MFKLNLPALFLLSSIYITSVDAKEPTIRLKVASNLSTVKVQGKKLWRKILKNKEESFKDSASLNFDCRGKGSEIPYLARPVEFAKVGSRSQQLIYNNKMYWGDFRVIVREKRRGCDLVNHLPLEQYITLVIGKEMSSKWPLEALKAQAVAARSYALYKVKSKFVAKKNGHDVFYDLINSEQYQVNGTLEDVNRQTLLATRETRGEVLVIDNNELTPIFYHSKCGGKTLTPGQVWNEDIKGYTSVACPFCYSHGVKPWKKTYRKNYIERLLSKKRIPSNQTSPDGKYFKIMPDSKEKSEIVYYRGKKLKVAQKSTLRKGLGTKRLLSNYYHIKDNGSHLEFNGRGHGHGVGMCQYGAYELAKRGYTYKQILNHYFPNHIVQTLY